MMLLEHAHDLHYICRMKAEKTEYPEVGGTYRHYKGGKYKVMTLAKHTETDEALVIYRSIGFGSVHARPLSQWFEIIDDSGSLPVKRFNPLMTRLG